MISLPQDDCIFLDPVAVGVEHRPEALGATLDPGHRASKVRDIFGDVPMAQDVNHIFGDFSDFRAILR